MQRKKNTVQNKTTTLQRIMSIFLAALLYLFALMMIIYVYPEMQSNLLFSNPNVFYYSSDIYTMFCAFSVLVMLLIFTVSLIILFYSGKKTVYSMRNKKKKRISKKKIIVLCIFVILSLFIAAAPLLVIKNRIEITNKGVYHYNKYGNVTETHMYADLSKIRIQIEELSSYRTTGTRYTISYILEFYDGYTIKTYLDGTGNGKYKDRALGMFQLDMITKKYAPKIVDDLENIERLKESSINMDFIIQIMNS